MVNKYQQHYKSCATAFQSVQNNMGITGKQTFTSYSSLLQSIFGRSDERIVGNRLLNNRIPNVIGSYDYRLRKVIVTK